MPNKTIHGYTVTGEWKPGQRGMTASAVKAGKEFFLKKYTKVVLPTYDGMFDKKTITAKEEEFNAFVKVRQEVIKALKPSAGPGGNIIIPDDSFIDGQHYYEATEFIDNVISDDKFESFVKGASSENLSMMMMTAAGALSAVHSRGIIHSDLKLRNIIVVKKSADHYVAKLIDFDSSYSVSNKKFIGGDDVYCSPELAEYVDCEEEEERLELVKKITPKTDIFSLGVVFHYYLSGEFPQAVELTASMQKIKAAKERAGKTAVFYPHYIVSSGCDLKLSDRITSVNLKVLLQSMMNIDPQKRPTAMQVLQALKAPQVKFEDPWPEHNITFVKTKLSDDKIVGVLKAKEGDMKRYEFIYESGKKTVFTKEEAVAKGYAKENISGWADPWPEDNIELDIPTLESRDFVAAKRDTLNKIKGYRLFRKDGGNRFMDAKNLCFYKFAKRKDTTVPKPVSVEKPAPELMEPWPEDSIVFDWDEIKAKGYIYAIRSMRDGIKGYELIKADGTKQFKPKGNLLLLKMAKKL